MADIALADLPNVVAVDSVDLVVIVDASDTSDGPDGTTKHTSVQAFLQDLWALHDLGGTAADQLAYFTGASSAALATLTTYARTILDDTTAAAARGTLGLGPLAALTISAKGDIGVGTGSGAVTALAVGSNGDYLSADSTATPGVRWVTPISTATHSARLAQGHQAHRLVKESDTGLVYWDTGIGWAIFNGNGLVRLTSNFTKNASITLSDITDLAWPVEANEVWKFAAFLLTTSVTTTPDLKIQFNAPAGAAGGFWKRSDSGGVAVGTTPATATAFGSPLSVGDGSGALNFKAVEIVGWIANGATAGTVQPQAAQDVSTAENTIVAANSFIEIRRYL
jgi:hypothetical protein